MTAAIVRSEKSFTRLDRARIAEDPGKPSRRLPGGYIDDLAALRKAIWLCGGVAFGPNGIEVQSGSCAGKFNYRLYDYCVKPNLPLVNGRCDGCGEQHASNVMFVPRSRTLL